MDETIKLWEQFSSDVEHELGHKEAIFKRVMNYKDGSIESTMMLGKAILNVFSELDETEINEFVEDYIADWSLSENKSWSGILLYHICEKYFACESIGLGYLRCDDQSDADITDAEEIASIHLTETILRSNMESSFNWSKIKNSTLKINYVL